MIRIVNRIRVSAAIPIVVGHGILYGLLPTGNTDNLVISLSVNMVAVLMLSPFFTNWLFVNNIQRIQTFVEELKTGVLSKRLPVSAESRIETDVSELNQLHQSLNWMARQIDNREKTIQEKVEELEAANAAAHAANEAKSTFLATMSHEIRTPLNGVIGNLELLEFTDLTGEQQELIQNTEVSAQTLLGIIGDILDFSKIEAGKVEIEIAEMTPANVLHEVEALLMSRAKQKGITFGHYVGPGVPHRVRSDAFRLRQVIMNYVSNAIKFTEKGGILLTLTVDGEDDNGRIYLRYDCIDTGYGFAPEKAKSLFEAFSQEDSSTTRKFGGTGLGLAICKKIAHLLGGDAGAQSVPGEGATFWVRIPVKVLEPEQKPSTDLSGISVLLVTHNAVGKTSHTASDRSRLDFAASITEAEALFSAARDAGKPYDVVAADMPLPDGNAVILRERLGAHQAAMLAFIPRHQQGESYRAYRAGYRLALMKPLGAVDLPHALRFVTNRLQDSQVERILSINIEEQREKLAKIGVRSPVLVIDDTPMNRIVARRQLKKLGLECDEAENGLEGLKKATTMTYALIFVDISMPVMDGLEFSQKLRAWEQEKCQDRLPLIAMTGTTTAVDRQRAFEAGMDDFLSKPVKIEDLSAALVTWLETQQSLGESSRAAALPEDGLVPAPATAPSNSAHEQALVPKSEIVPVTTEAAEAIFDKAPPVDMKSLAELLDEDDPETLKEILNFFLETFDPLFETFEGHVAAGERMDVKMVAHASKSAARNAGALALGEVLARAESTALDADWAEIQNLAQQARAQFNAVTGFVRAL